MFLVIAHLICYALHCLMNFEIWLWYAGFCNLFMQPDLNVREKIDSNRYMARCFWRSRRKISPISCCIPRTQGILLNCCPLTFLFLLVFSFLPILLVCHMPSPTSFLVYFIFKQRMLGVLALNLLDNYFLFFNINSNLQIMINVWYVHIVFAFIIYRAF